MRISRTLGGLVATLAAVTAIGVSGAQTASADSGTDGTRVTGGNEWIAPATTDGTRVTSVDSGTLT
jgi:hypothetical protein